VRIHLSRAQSIIFFAKAGRQRSAHVRCMHCRVQSTFNALGGEIKGKTLALGGDGRYFNKQAAQIIIKLAAGNGISKVTLGPGRHWLLVAFTDRLQQHHNSHAPAGDCWQGRHHGHARCISRDPAPQAGRRSHHERQPQPRCACDRVDTEDCQDCRVYQDQTLQLADAVAGGPDEDWGIKMNSTAGEPAPERITNEIFKYTESIDTLNMADIPDVDLSSIGSTSHGDFEVSICAGPYLAGATQRRMTVLANRS
jgi:Phosphoglucomutase/phosphomannomutase, alpha/beta/alpha domain I